MAVTVSAPHCHLWQLRAANIEIPFNQLDVNLRDLEALRRELGAACPGAAKWQGMRLRQPTQRQAKHGNGNRVTSTGD